MKQIILYLFCLVTYCSGYTQNVSFTIRPGTTENSAKVYIKTNSAISGVISQTLLTFAIPTSVGSRPTPSFTLNSTFSHLTQTLNTPLTQESLNGESNYIFTYYSAYLGNISSSLTPTGGSLSNGEYEFGEIKFSNPGSVPGTLRLCNLPDGGSSGISYLLWEIGAVNLSNPLALTYGTGSTNSAQGFGGLSFVPLTIVLPTKFLSFYANKTDDNAKLTWSVENEEDNAYFEVEASVDGRIFKTVQKVNALRNGRSANTYELMDSRISRYNAGTVYYRIKQIEASGKITYTDVRILKLDAKNFIAALYPNPVKTITKLVIEAPEPGKATVVIRDAGGKAVKQLSLQLQKGTNQQELDASTLAAGDYNVTIMAEKLNQTIKLTKSN